jgi:hypothetical protein
MLLFYQIWFICTINLSFFIPVAQRNVKKIPIFLTSMFIVFLCVSSSCIKS